MIGETPYLTFADALAAAQAGQTITLLANVTASEIITIEKAITLDGNGKTLTSTAARAINVDCAGEVTIKNLTVTTTGERGINVINKACTLTLTAVNVTAYNYTVNVAATAAEAKVTITDSTLTGKNVVNVAASDAIITIDGTTLTCVDKSANEYYATLFLNKDAKGATITATNMTFNLSGDSKKATNQAENGTITIDGLTNEVSINVATLVRGEYWYGFETIDAALATAEAGETITLIRDVTASEIITIEKAITLDGNGKTLTSTAARAINVDCAGAVTIKNLTIDAGERAINIINKAATVTINGVTATAANNAVMIATSADAVNLSIDDCSFTGLAVVSVNGAGAQVTIANSTIANVDANKNENYGAITVGNTAENATVAVTNTSITVADDSKKAYNFNSTATITGVDQVGVVVAMIGEAGYDTIEEAAGDVKAGQTIVLKANVTVATPVVVPAGAMLDLNGKASTGTILGTIAVNGGTYVTAEGQAVIGKNARTFESTNAVFTMDAVAGNISLDAGTVTAKDQDGYGNNWTLPGQALIIKSGVTLTVPAEVTMQVNGTSITIEDGATLNIAGKINLYSADATIAAAEVLTVTTTVAGCEVKYADGKYTVVKSIVIEDVIAATPAAEAIKAAMEAAGVTEIESYTITTKNTPKTDAEVADVADVLAVFEVNPTVNADGVLTVAYEFGISSVTNEGEVITITAGVTGAEYREGVAVVFYADGDVIGTATTTANSSTVSITDILAEDIKGKKITVKAAK
jgi:TusA-related sulfurtransferase